MNIGLDFDGTADQDPELWRQFIHLCQSRGHRVFVTTARFENNIKDIEAALPGVEIIPSNGKPKKMACDAADLSIDIWIDDMPQIIME